MGYEAPLPRSHPDISKSCGQHTRFPEGASPVSDLHRPGRRAGACFPRAPFPREGALMAHFRYPAARMPAPETAR